MSDGLLTSKKQAILEWRKRDDLIDKPWSLVAVWPDGKEWQILMADEPLDVRRPDETSNELVEGLHVAAGLLRGFGQDTAAEICSSAASKLSHEPSVDPMTVRELQDHVLIAINERDKYAQQRADWKAAYEGQLERIASLEAEIAHREKYLEQFTLVPKGATEPPSAPPDAECGCPHVLVDEQWCVHHNYCRSVADVDQETRREAERYRWLRSHIAGTIVQRLCRGETDWRQERMDALIDGALGPSLTKVDAL